VNEIWIFRRGCVNDALNNRRSHLGAPTLELELYFVIAAVDFPQRQA
jgi:hypothetical protein